MTDNDYNKHFLKVFPKETCNSTESGNRIICSDSFKRFLKIFSFCVFKRSASEINSAREKCLSISDVTLIEFKQIKLPYLFFV